MWHHLYSHIRYFPMFPSKSCRNCIILLFPVGNLNVELMNIVHISWGRGWVGSGRVGSGRVRLFVGNRGSGRVNVSPGRVGSGPRKVTRGQLCSLLCLFVTICIVVSGFIYSYTFDRKRLLHVIITPCP